MPAPEIPAKKANKKNSLLFVKKYIIIEAEENTNEVEVLVSNCLFHILLDKNLGSD
tara:strand:- start:274 stop:441 length:168 start_codon:yes stop_codon:yes gene_type:complete